MEITTVMSIAGVIVLGVCQMLKVGGVKSKYIPICGLVVGILCSWIVPDLNILGGILGAFSAMGIYSGVKSTLKTV